MAGIALYEFVGNFRKVLEMEVSSAEDAQALTELLDESTEDVEQKVLRIGYLIRQIEAEAKAAREEEKRIADLRKTRENKVKRLKDYALWAMEQVGLEKAEDVAIKVYTAKNPESLHILDEEDIPKEFYVQPDPVLDKTALTKWAKENPANGFCWMESSGKNLRIK
jgi:hypothetical protein